jgi:hypothetical protein
MVFQQRISQRFRHQQQLPQVTEEIILRHIQDLHLKGLHTLDPQTAVSEQRSQERRVPTSQVQGLSPHIPDRQVVLPAELIQAVRLQDLHQHLHIQGQEILHPAPGQAQAAQIAIAVQAVQAAVIPGQVARVPAEAIRVPAEPAQAAVIPGQAALVQAEVILHQAVQAAPERAEAIQEVVQVPVPVRAQVVHAPAPAQVVQGPVQAAAEGK